MAKVQLEIPAKQAEMLMQLESKARQAMSDMQLALQVTLSAVEDVPDGASLQAISTDPPSITLVYEEQDDDGDS